MREIELFGDYENARIVDVDEYREGHPGMTVAFDRLGKTEIDGIPVSLTRNGAKKLEVTFVPYTHLLAIGATRSGKTTGYVLPTLNILSRKKNKPSLVISDPKQEIYKKTVSTMRENGYDVILIDFTDYRRSDCWNPLTEIYRTYKKYLDAGNGVTVVKTDHGLRNSFRGVICEDQAELDRRVDAVRDGYLAEAEKRVQAIALSVIPPTGAKDPFWDGSARDLFCAMLYGMMEDIRTNEITERTFSFDTVLRIFDSFSADSDKYDGGYFTSRPPDSKAYQLAKKCIIEQAENTRKCIASTFAEKMSKFRDTSVRKITSANTFEVSDLDEGRPKAFYITFKDEESLHYDVITMFLTDMYTKLIALARQEGGRLKRPFCFVLDEFGNLPRFSDFDKVISACGGRNIWFMLILQSYAQLDNIYKKEIAEIIRDNLNTHIFFGTNNPQTKREFSEECGKKTIISPTSALNGEGESIMRYDKDTVSLVPVSALNKIAPGECIVTQMNDDVMWSHFERSYTCGEFDVPELSEDELYEHKFDFLDVRYRYEPEKKNGSDAKNKRMIG